jgi:outer membrane protein
MKKIGKFALSLLLLAAVSASAQSLKIGFVNGFRIEAESEQTKQAIELIKKEFAPREQQLQALQKQGVELRAELDREGTKLKPAEVQAREKRLAALSQQFEQMQRSFAEDMEFRQREARARLIGEINAVVSAIAEAEKFDLIVQQAIFTSSQVDLTDRVIKELAKRASAAAR